ncbi:MAG: Arc family DNA-binding protein [Spirochaetaceae bacterium]|nr:Arc family DNA-binding protein [Spirochaetaceae bacterium]
MKSVHVTQVPPETVDALKRLARSNHRSLQCELRAILERAARMAPPDTAGDEFRLVTVKTGYAGSWSRELIYGADGR